MGKAFMYGFGGGSALNFSLKAYSTEAALLADTPKENTVGVVTETAISDYTFSSAQPTAKSDGTALSGGEVWIIEGTPSPIAFNALKGNGKTLMVYPAGCYQYNGSAWKQKDCYVRKGNEWVNIGLYLYNLGDQYAALTGGWQARGWLGQTSFMVAAPSITFNSRNMYAVAGVGGGVIEVMNDIDLTNISKITLSYNSTNVSAQEFGLCLIVVPRNAQYALANSVALTNLISGNQTVSVDVAALSGYYDVAIFLYGYNTGNRSDITVYWAKAT